MSGRLGGVQGALDRIGRRPETPVVLCIDVEPDPRVVDRAKAPPWDGFERTVEEVQALRERVCDMTGKPAAFTWHLRMDPQVEESYGSPAWVAEEHGALLDDLAKAGDELGVHTHVWRWDPDAAVWVNDFVDPVWAEHCLTMGLEAFESSFGRPCPIHRGGDHFLSGGMIPVLERHGVEVDLTVEPGLPPQGAESGEVALGTSPDYRDVPHRPYRSGPERFPAADPASTSDLLFVPLASAARTRPPFRRFPLSLGDPPKGFGRRLVAELLRRPPNLAFPLRTDAVLDSEFWKLVIRNLEQVAKHRRIAFTTASEAV